MTLTLEQNQLMGLLTKALFGQDVQTKAAGASEGPYLHGPGGTWSTPGLNRDVISTHIQIVDSLAAILPVRTTIFEQPLFPYITGFVRSDQQEKDGVCDDPEEAGQMKTCILTTALGRKEFRTRELEVNRVGRLNNRGEMNDLQVVNTPLVNALGGLFTQKFALGRSHALKAANEMNIRFMEVAVAFDRWICPTIYTGNPANNSAGKGYMEFPGLDLLVGTNKPDAITGLQCESLYSDIKDYNFVDITNQNAPYNIVHVLTQWYRKLKQKARQQNMWPADLRFVMRPQLFDIITDIWACEYWSYRCQATGESGNSGMNQTFNDGNPVSFRDSMKLGRYLMIDGVKIPVVLDDCILEENNDDNGSIPLGSVSSDIYLLPFSIRGGSRKTLFFEAIDMSAGPMQTAQIAGAAFAFWSDAGRFLWSINPLVNWCLTAIAKLEPRLILEVPQLAGRLTNVVATHLQHWDDPLPSQDYHLNGGVPTGRPAPSPFSEWNLGGQGLNT